LKLLTIYKRNKHVTQNYAAWPLTVANQKEKEPEQNQGKIQDEAPKEYLRRNLKTIFQVP
jgi:hypothetical protein